MRNNFLILFLFIITTSVFAGEPVHFQDEILRRAVEQKLGISNPTSTDMLNLKELHFNHIRNLTGLEHAKNLTSFYMSGNKYMRVNKPRSSFDISVLSSLTNLKILTLQNCSIEDISALSSLKKLETLNLNNNNISGDLSALFSLINLKSLSLSRNRINDISHLSSLRNLRTLDLYTNQISDISALSPLVKLESLSLERNQKIRDINALSSLINLNVLSLSFNSIEDVSALSSLTDLTTLRLYDNKIRDISAFSSLRNLKYLSLRHNFVKDASVLSSLPQLQSVDLRNNPCYFRRFLKIAIGVVAILFVLGLAIHLYLNKTQKKMPKVLLLTKISLACCVMAPLLCWFCFHFLGNALSKQTMNKLRANLFISSCVHISVVVSFLIVGIVCSVIALKKIRKDNNRLAGKSLTIASLIVLLILSVLCGMAILFFIISPYYRPYYP